MVALNFFTVYFLAASLLLSAVLLIDMLDIRRDRKSFYALVHQISAQANQLREKTEERYAVLDEEFPVRTYGALPEGAKRNLEELLILLKREVFPEDTLGKRPV